MMIFPNQGLKGMTPMDIKLGFFEQKLLLLRAKFFFVRQNEPNFLGTFSDFKLEVYMVYVMFFK